MLHIMSVTNFNHIRQMGMRSFEKRLRLSVSNKKGYDKMPPCNRAHLAV